LSDRCPSCLSVLSVTLVYCGQTVGRIKMKLGMQLGLGPGHIVRWGPGPLPPRGTAPILAYICCGQMAGWNKIPLGMEVGLSPGDFVLDGDPAPLPKKGAQPQFFFGPCLLRPNGWMHQDGTWHGGGPWSRPHCARWRSNSPPQKGGRAPNFRPISIELS